MQEKRVLKGIIVLLSCSCLVLFVLTILWVNASEVGNTATGGVATDGVATSDIASEGIGVGIASDMVSNDNIWDSDDCSSVNKIDTTGEKKLLEYYIENNTELTIEEFHNSYEYVSGRLDYLDVDSEASSKKGFSDIVLEYVSSAEKEAISRATSSGYKNVSLYRTEESKLATTNNYDQDLFNFYYNKENATNYTGTCVETAGVSMIEYYHRKGYGGTIGHSYKYTIFNKLLNEAIKCGAYPVSVKDGGTYNSKFKTVISRFYDYYKVNLDGEYINTSVKTTVEKCIKNDKPVVGHFTAPDGSGHAMCINGYYDIWIGYKSGTYSYSYRIYRYYRVNDGWHMAYASNDSDTDARLQYIWEGYLTSLTRIE